MATKQKVWKGKRLKRPARKNPLRDAPGEAIFVKLLEGGSTIGLAYFSGRPPRAFSLKAFVRIITAGVVQAGKVIGYEWGETLRHCNRRVWVYWIETLGGEVFPITEEELLQWQQAGD